MYLVSLGMHTCTFMQAERERLEKEIEARKEAERKKAELEERIKELEGKAKEGNETKEQTDRTVEVLEEKVEEKAQAHAQKNLQLEEEIRASAVKVNNSRHKFCFDFQLYCLCLWSIHFFVYFVCLFVVL